MGLKKGAQFVRRDGRDIDREGLDAQVGVVGDEDGTSRCRDRSSVGALPVDAAAEDDVVVGGAVGGPHRVLLPKRNRRQQTPPAGLREQEPVKEGACTDTSGGRQRFNRGS